MTKKKIESESVPKTKIVKVKVKNEYKQKIYHFSVILRIITLIIIFMCALLISHNRPIIACLLGFCVFYNFIIFFESDFHKDDYFSEWKEIEIKEE